MIGRHPDANRLLSDLESVLIECDDCGHRRRFGFRELKVVLEYGAFTYGELWNRARCMECPRGPGSRRNIVLHPTWRCEEVAAA